jgi:triacylglycerol esterase/lipase EstA (alpha/beta hydrolase family)
MLTFVSNNIYRIALNRLLAILTALACQSAFAQDYEREARWEEQVVSQLVVGDAIKIRAASGKEFLGLFTASKEKTKAVILLHGVGAHPDFGITGQLRVSLNDLGYTTLAIQLPVQGKDAKLDDYYPKVFGDAKDRIAQSIAWLAAKGFDKPLLLSHSMGSWMANEYLDENFSRNTISAWVCMSLTGSYSWTMRRYTMPILDVYAENDIAPAVSSASRRKMALTSEGSSQYRVTGAQPDYSGHATAIAKRVQQFIEQ